MGSPAITDLSVLSSSLSFTPAGNLPGGCTSVTFSLFAINAQKKDAIANSGKNILSELDALRTSLVRLLPRLRRFAWSLTRNHADAEDLLQATCERAMLNAERAPLPDVTPWTMTMMRNLWVSEIRKRQVRERGGTTDAETAPELTASEGPDDAYGHSQILDHIRALPEGFASVLLLVSVEGHTYKEAAEILDIPVGTVMSRMSSAREKLRTILAGDMV